MPVPSTIADLSTVANDNSPQGSEPIGTSLDNYIRAAFAFIKQLSTGSGASGTWEISITGNAATATSATTATTAKNTAVDSPSGTFGYVAGSGGTVTQATSKSTAVTLNKPSGIITMNGASLAAGASVEFQVNNTFFKGNAGDVVVVNAYAFGINYRVEARASGGTSFSVRVTNITGSTLSDAVIINFAIIKGAAS